MFEVLKWLTSIGAVGLLINVLGSRFLSTEVEKALETNTERVIRIIINYIISFFCVVLILVGLVVISGVTNSEVDKNTQKNNTSSLQVKEESDVDSSTPKEDKDLKSKVDGDDKVYNYTFAVVIMIGLTFIFYGFINMFGELYKKYTYIYYSGSGPKYKLYIDKRIEKDKVLLTYEENANQHKIINFSALEGYIIYTDSIEETNERRYKMIYKNIQLQKDSKAIWAAVIIGGIYIIFLMIIAYLQEGWRSLLIPIIMITGGLFYFIYQYTEGKKLVENSQS